MDVLQALVRQLLGNIEQENPDVFLLMQKKLEEAFLAAFPNRAKQRTETTTFVRNREICAAVIIQKAWRARISRNKVSSNVVANSFSIANIADKASSQALSKQDKLLGM